MIDEDQEQTTAEGGRSKYGSTIYFLFRLYRFVGVLYQGTSNFPTISTTNILPHAYFRHE